MSRLDGYDRAWEVANKVPCPNIYKRSYVSYDLVEHKLSEPEVDPGYTPRPSFLSMFNNIDIDTFILNAGLNSQEAEVIRYIFQENLTQCETGEKMGLSQSYINRLLHRALEKIKLSLAS